MPVSGGLYTAQHPLFSMFIGGLVAYREQDREVIRNLFKNIISGTRGVSSLLCGFPLPFELGSKLRFCVIFAD